VNFVAHDAAGNRGTLLEQAVPLKLDTAAPTVVVSNLPPVIKNNSASPAIVPIEIELDEPLAINGVPVLTYQLSGSARSGNLTMTPVANSNGLRWATSLVLPSDAGAVPSANGPQPEDLVFGLNATDALGNTGGRFAIASTVLVYQGELPGLVPPALNAASAPGGVVKLSWAPVAKADSYILYSGLTNDPQALTLLATLPATQLTYDHLPASDGTYFYAIAPRRTVNGEPSALILSNPPVAAISDRLPPGVPTNLALSLIGQGVSASWSAPVPSEALTYQLLRSATQPLTLNATVIRDNISGTQALDTNPTSSATHYAAVAVDAVGNRSQPSAHSTLNAALYPPAQLVITADLLGQTPISLRWTQSGSAHSGHKVSVGDQDPLDLLGVVPAGVNAFQDRAYDGTTRRYVMATIDAADNSSPLKSLRLPAARIALDPGQSLGKGIINRVRFQVTNSSAFPISNAVLMAGFGNQTNSSAVFQLAAGASAPVDVFVPGYTSLAAPSATLDITLQVEPTPGSKAALTTPVSLPVVDQAIPVTLQVRDLLRGGTGRASFTVQNPGSQELEILLARNQGAQDSPDARFRIRSTTGQEIASIPIRAISGNGVINLAGGSTVLRVPPGATVSSPEFSIPVPLSSPADVAFSLEIDRFRSNSETAQETVLEIPLTRSLEVSTLAPSYSARIVTATPQTSRGNEPVILAGNATFQSGGGLAGNQPVAIAISRDSFLRTVDVVTAADGTFATPFVLPAGEPGGTFTVWAHHPDQTNFTPPDADRKQFTINRVIATPVKIQWTAPRNYAQTFPISVSVLGGNATNVRGLLLPEDQPTGQLLPGILFESTSIPTLSSTGSVNLNVRSDGTAPANGRLVVRMVSDETAPLGFQTIEINFSLSEARPAIVAQPAYLSTGVNQGASLTETVTIRNNGLAPLLDATWDVLSSNGTAAPSWVRRGSSANLGQLAPGSSAELILDFSPPATQLEGDHNLILVVRGSNTGPITIPIHVAVSQSGNGSFSLKAIDFRTGSTAANGTVIGGVQNARIRFQKSNTPSILFEATTDANGEIGQNGSGLAGIPVGLYDLTISSDKHQTYRSSLWIRPNATTLEQAVLQYQTVSVSWEVVETTIRDSYEVVTTINYETDVPIPVIVASPAAINLPAMAAGAVYNSEIVIKNVGAISPDTVELQLPANNANFRVNVQPNAFASPSANDPSKLNLTLPPGQELRLPVTITALRDVTCVSTFLNGYSITLCPNGTTHRQDFTIGIFSPCPTIVGSGSGSSSSAASYWVSGGGGGSAANWTPTPAPTTDDCFEFVYRPGGSSDPEDICAKREFSSGGADTGDTTGGGTSGSNSGATQPASSSVDLINREYLDGREDLTIAAPGGAITLRRDFYGNEWHFAHDQRLTFVPTSNGLSTATIIRHRVPYPSRNATGTSFALDGYTFTKEVTQGVVSWKWSSPGGKWERYDANGRLTETGFRDRVLSVVYFAAGADQPSELRDSAGRTLVTLNYANGKLSSATDLASRTVSYTWQNGRLTVFTDAVGNTITMAYDAAGRITSKVDRNGQTITIRYTPAGFVSAVLGGEKGDQQYAFSYNSSTRIHYSRVTFGASRIVESWYDRDGELTKSVENGVTLATRVRSGRTINETDALGRTTTREYDALNNVIRQIDPDGITQSWDYDPTYQQILRHTDRRGVVTSNTYDPVTQRLLTTTVGLGTPAAQTTAYQYDASSRLVEVTNPRGTKTRFTYSTQHDLPQTSTRGFGTPLAQTDTHTYDAVGNLETTTNTLNQETSFEYDALSRLRKSINALNEEAHFTYNGTRLTRIETGKTASQPGRAIRRTYDDRGRITSEHQIGTNGTELLLQASTYDSEGRVLTATNALGQTVQTFVYDAFGRETSRSAPNALGGQALASTQYDLLGRIVATVSPDGLRREIAYQPTSNRPASLTEAPGSPFTRVTEMIYDTRGDLVAERFPDGTTTLETLYTYDALGRRASASGARVQDDSVSYDAAGNILTSTDGRGHVTTSTYDVLGRLKTLTLPPVAGSPAAITTFTYDAGDNLISQQDGDGRTTGFAYDPLDRLVATSLPTLSALPGAWATQPGIIATQTTYTRFGEVDSVSAPASAIASGAPATSNRSQTVFDPFGRAKDRIVQTGPGKTITSTTSYSPAGQPLSSSTTGTDIASPQTTSWEYDANNPAIVRSVTEPTGATTT